MSKFMRNGAVMALGSAMLLAQLGHVHSQTANLPILVVTPLRAPLALARSGSAITVISRKEIESWGARNVTDLLRGSPGVDVSGNGGPGTLTNVTLRGSNPGQTLILIDGMRAGDPSSITGAFDFGSLSTQDIERVEILRGPQSAVYGSDAMGGVVNIITRKGSRKPLTTLIISGGSYGTINSSLSTSGGTDKLSYAFSIAGFHTKGFSRYGYRIGRITSQFTRPLEKDKTTKASGSARVSYRPAPGVEIDLGFRSYSNRLAFDNPGAFFLNAKDTSFNKGRQNVTLAFARISNIILDGKLKNSLTLFSSHIKRFNRLEQSCFNAVFMSFDCEVRFLSIRYGAEYQGNLKLGKWGLFIFGARYEVEKAKNSEQWLAPTLSAPMVSFSGKQTTKSFFVLYQNTIGRFDFSLGARSDTVGRENHFITWRATAAYRIEETGTKIRASIGTGAKAPTLFQRFSIYGTPGLQPERNIGYEIGLDQSLWNGLMKVSVTIFETVYNDLIDFNFLLNNGVGGYFNVGKAKMRGVEVSADINLEPQNIKIRAGYTYLHAQDLDADTALLRRPKHKGFISLVYTGIPKLRLEGRVTLVGSRMDIQNDFPYSRVKMPPFAKLDVRASYQVNKHINLFARIENVTNARYQIIRDYATAGRSIYGGAKVTW